MIIHWVLRYEFIISTYSKQKVTSKSFLVAGCVRKVALQKEFQYWVGTDIADGNLASFVSLLDTFPIVTLQILLHYCLNRVLFGSHDGYIESSTTGNSLG